MVAPDFKSMSYDELVDYALAHGEGCRALEEYVKRQSQDPNTIIFDPRTDPNWADKLVAAIQEQIESSKQSSQ